MKKKQQSPTRSKSARRNGRADNDTNRRETFILFDYGRPYRVSMPAGTFDRMVAKIAELERKRH
jgi:hypothetical protein